MRMNDFENFMNNKPNAEEVLSHIDTTDEQEKGLIAASIIAFNKKKESLSKLLLASKSMDMIMDIMRSVAGDKLPEGIPNSNEMIEQGEKVISALDGIIEAFQIYGIESAKFNDIARNDIREREKFKDKIDEED